MSLFRTEQDEYADVAYSYEEVGNYTAALLGSWAKNLPTSSHGILDMAAGLGIESKLLHDMGHDVTAYDRSQHMRAGAIYNVKSGDMTNVRLRNSSYSGALIKDAWVFMDDNSREKTLSNIFPALVSGGSILIISQLSDNRVHIIPYDSKFPIKVLESDFSEKRAWERYLKEEVSRGGKVIAVEYETNNETMLLEGKNAGLKVTVETFGFNSALAQENRWRKTHQVVAVMTK